MKFTRLIGRKGRREAINNIWYLVNDLTKGNEPLVLATLFGKSGSTPRSNGTKMIIQANGMTTGTIGGGLLEKEVRELAGQVFHHKISRVHRFNFNAAEIAATDMICGGKCEVLLDYIDGANPAQREIYAGIVNALNKCEDVWLITGMNREITEPADVNKLLVSIHGSISGSLECHPEVLQSMLSTTSASSTYVLDNRRFLVEPIHDRDWLYIFGAGHIAKQLAILAEMVDFRTVVVDDRFEYANRERFPNAGLLVLDSFENLPAALDILPHSYLVIVTRAHLHDKTVLGQVLKIPAAYVGMIASRRKRQVIFDALQAELGFNAQDLARVHSPIGLEIMAETPEEIAVSIVAELIKVRAERKQCNEK